MKIAPTLLLALAFGAQAQTDKALHLLGSAGLGLSLRHITNSKPAAFWGTVAIGAAKELEDERAGAARQASSGDMAANALGAGLALILPKPDYIGAMTYSHHTRNYKRRLTGNTPGLLLGWDAGWLPWDRGSIDAALFRNSQGGASFYAGLGKEWNPAPRWYVGLGAGAVYGYRENEIYSSMSGPLPGWLYGCVKVEGGRACVYEVPQKSRWNPAALLKLRYYIGSGFSLQAIYMPAGTVARALKRPGWQAEADAVNLQVIYRKEL